MSDSAMRSLDILRALGSRPTAPFYEQGIAKYIEGFLSGIDVASHRDPYGNLIAHYSNARAQDRSMPAIAFVAHMDHPGYEITGTCNNRIVARALGGVPAASFSKRIPALAITQNGDTVSCELHPINVAARDGRRVVEVVMDYDRKIKPPVPVIFDLPGFELDEGFIKMGALDDLAGCASILAALERVVAEGLKIEVYAVFTRAEEVGLYGARVVAESRTIPLETFIVSVEASSVILGVEQGDGPVIRVGDAAYTFDSEAEQILVAAREEIRNDLSEFRCQRQLMSGGVCEATAFAIHGYRTTGVALPLGNYHNATTSIPDTAGGVAREYISQSDYLGGIELIAKAATCVEMRHNAPARRLLGALPDSDRNRLSASRSQGFGYGSLRSHPSKTQ